MRIIDLIPEEIRQRLELRDGPHDRPDAPRIVGIEPQTECCGDCGDTVTGRTVEYVQFNTPFDYWRTQCKNCKRICNPISGAWETLTHNQILAVSRPVYNRTDK